MGKRDMVMVMVMEMVMVMVMEMAMDTDTVMAMDTDTVMAMDTDTVMATDMDTENNNQRLSNKAKVNNQKSQIGLAPALKKTSSISMLVLTEKIN